MLICRVDNAKEITPYHLHSTRINLDILHIPLRVIIWVGRIASILGMNFGNLKHVVEKPVVCIAP